MDDILLEPLDRFAFGLAEAKGRHSLQMLRLKLRV